MLCMLREDPQHYAQGAVHPARFHNRRSRWLTLPKDEEGEEEGTPPTPKRSWPLLGPV